MELSPYLQAIQNIKGKTPGEKYQALHTTAKENIAATISEDGGSSNCSFFVHPNEGQPTPLLSLLQLEAARIGKNGKIIVDALKSDDKIVFNRAVKVKWFFDSTNSKYLNGEYFKEHIFPCISLGHRVKLIKTLAATLSRNQPVIADDFYTTISRIYGKHQARPLLKACNESFIWNTVVNDQIVLSNDEVNYLFSKYSELIIKYLKLPRITLDKYKSSLPRLIKKHSTVFVELICKYMGMEKMKLINVYETNEFKLNFRYTRLFLTEEMDTFMDKPKQFIDILSMKQLTRQLTFEQFEKFYEKLHPENETDYDINNMIKYLKYFPQEKQLSILLSNFKKVYKKNLLNSKASDATVAGILPLLSRELRIKTARKKLKTDKSWHIESNTAIKYSWRCYLPVEESIPAIKLEVSKTEDDNRISIMKQLIYTCKINNNPHVLVKTLRFFRYRQDIDKLKMTEVIGELPKVFELESLSLEHWGWLTKNLRRLNLNIINFFDKSIWDLFQSFIVASIKFDYKNNQNITGKLFLLLKRDTHHCCTIANTIPLVNAIYAFNKCNMTGKYGRKISLKKYPYFYSWINELITTRKQDKDEIKILISLIRDNEPHLLAKLNLKKRKHKYTNIQLCIQASVTLKRDPHDILSHWNDYYKLSKTYINYRCIRNFLKSCRWYQDIPIKFIKQCVYDITINGESQAIKICAVLLEGPVLEKFLLECVPKYAIIDQQGLIFKKHLDLKPHIQASLGVINPPLSLGFIMKYFENNLISVMLTCALVLKQCIGANKLLPLAEGLINRTSSIEKDHGISMLLAIATSEGISNIIKNHWNTEINKCLNTSIIKIIIKVFLLRPCFETWALVNDLMDDIGNNYERHLPELKIIQFIPREFIAQYTNKLLSLIQKFSDANKTKENNCYEVCEYTFDIENTLENLTPQRLIFVSEEFHERIIKTYFLDVTQPTRIIIAAYKYLINSYILSSDDHKLDQRFTFFSTVFVEIVKNHWDESHHLDAFFYPANNFLKDIIRDVTILMQSNNVIAEKFIRAALDSFLSVLKPEQEPVFYCHFTLSALYQYRMTPKELANKIKLILPSLIKIFTEQFIPTIANILHTIIINLYPSSNALLDVIDRFLAFRNDNTCYLASALLIHQKSTRNEERVLKIVRTLRKRKLPVVTAYTNMAFNAYRHRLFCIN